MRSPSGDTVPVTPRKVEVTSIRSPDFPGPRVCPLDWTLRTSDEAKAKSGSWRRSTASSEAGPVWPTFTPERLRRSRRRTREKKFTGALADDIEPVRGEAPPSS